MFRILLAALCLFIVSQDVHAKAKTKKSKSKTAGWFAKLTPAKQQKVMEAVRDYNLAAEKWHPLVGEAAKKRASLFNLINEAQAQVQDPDVPGATLPPTPPPPDDDGPGDQEVGGPDDRYPVCRFGGWRSILRRSRSDDVMRCVHPKTLTAEEATVNNPPYDHGTCDPKTEIMCGNFLAPGKCVAYKTATQNCVDSEDALKNAVAYARAHTEEFERYIKEVVGECRADADNIKGFDAIQKDQRSTCRKLKTSLDALQAGIAAAIEAEELEAGKPNTGEDAEDFCTFKSEGKDYSINLGAKTAAAPKGTVAIRSGGKVIGEDLPLYEEAKVPGTPPRLGYKVNTRLGFLTFLKPLKGAQTTCDSAYLSVEPVVPNPVNNRGFNTCSYKTPGQSTPRFRVEWAESGNGIVKIQTLNHETGAWDLYREGTMDGGVWKAQVASGTGKGVPVTFEATGATCGQFKFDFGTPAATTPAAGGGGQQ